MSSATANMLKDCPFCNGEASIGTTTISRWKDASGNYGEFTGYSVNCISCGVSNRGVAEGFQTKEAAASKWNERADSISEKANVPDGPEVLWMVGDEYPWQVYTSRAEALSHGHKPTPLLRAEVPLLTDLCNWGLSHKKSCQPPASNFQAGKDCKCGRDALLRRLRVAIGRANERAIR